MTNPDQIAATLDAGAKLTVALNDYRTVPDAAAVQDAAARLRAVTTSADLYAAYKRWAAAVGEDAMTQRALAPLLRERGLDSVKHGTVRWLGVRLTTEQGSVL